MQNLMVSEAGACGPIEADAAGAWDETLLATLTELNERMLASMQRIAARPAPPRRPPLIERLREEWCALDAPLRGRLGACPYLLLDAGFGHAVRWQRPGVERPGLEVHDACAPHGYFSGPEGVALVRSTLLFAWHLARSNRIGARLLLGMSAGCADRIASCRLQDLELTAEQAPAWVVPRWEQQPRVWRQLFSAARLGEPSPLRWAQLAGVQLLAAG